MDAIVMKRLIEMIEHREEAALVTVTHKLGSGPRDSGSMMIVNRAGELVIGTIGGGGVEERAKKDAQDCIKNDHSTAFHYELNMKDSPESLGMACGGSVDVFIKVFKAQDPLFIFGGGHIGLELCHFAKKLNYNVTVIDPREEFANVERFPDADYVISGDFDNIVKNLKFDETSSIVIITHGHTHDLDALRAIINYNVRYIGMIGSQNKIKFCFTELLNEGVERSRLENIFAPIGLDIGGESPSEIALSILSEIQAVKYAKGGAFLVKNRRDPFE